MDFLTDWINEWIKGLLVDGIMGNLSGLLPNLYFKFACLSKIIIALFPLRYPMICDILYFGGIERSK